MFCCIKLTGIKAVWLLKLKSRDQMGDVDANDRLKLCNDVKAWTEFSCAGFSDQLL